MCMQNDIEGMNRVKTIINSMELKQVNRLNKFKDKLQDSINSVQIKTNTKGN